MTRGLGETLFPPGVWVFMQKSGATHKERGYRRERERERLSATSVQKSRLDKHLQGIGAAIGNLYGYLLSANNI